MHLARSIGPLPIDLGEQEVGEQLDLSRLERRRGIGQLQPEPLQIRHLHVGAAAVAVGEPVERRHALAGPSALDGADDAVAIEPGRAQVGPVGHLAVHLAAIAGPAVTRLTVALLPENPHAGGDVFAAGRRRLRARSGRGERRDADARGWTATASRNIVSTTLEMAAHFNGIRFAGSGSNDQVLDVGLEGAPPVRRAPRDDDHVARHDAAADAVVNPRGAHERARRRLPALFRHRAAGHQRAGAFEHVVDLAVHHFVQDGVLFRRLRPEDAVDADAVARRHRRRESGDR